MREKTTTLKKEGIYNVLCIKTIANKNRWFTATLFSPFFIIVVVWLCLCCYLQIFFSRYKFSWSFKQKSLANGMTNLQSFLSKNSCNKKFSRKKNTRVTTSFFSCVLQNQCKKTSKILEKNRGDKKKKEKMLQLCLFSFYILFCLLSCCQRTAYFFFCHWVKKRSEKKWKPIVWHCIFF